MLNSSSRAARRQAKDASAVVTDSVDTLASQFDAAGTSTAAVRTTTISEIPAEAPAQSRRELRERAERDAKAARIRPAARAARSAAPSARAAAPAARAHFTARATPAAARAVRPKLFAAPPRAKAARTRPDNAPKLVVTPSASAKSPRAVGFKRKLASKFVTVSAMVGVGMMLVATTVPANAFARPETVISAVSTARAQTQELKVKSVAAPALTRDGYTVVSLARQVQASFGNRTFTYTNNPTGAVQWPFPDGSPIASGFGPRQVAGCGFCSTYHQGLDFTPGSGTPIHSLADGIVSAVSTSGAFGNSVIIDHVVNGQKVQTLYAHMQYGSIRVAKGQSVTAGEVVGQVGSTGNSTGAHLHLEVHLDGTPVDPYAWLNANAG